MHISQYLSKELTATQAPPTQAIRPVNTKAWAEWFKLNLFDDPALSDAVSAAARFVKDAEQDVRPMRWLTLLGASGVGKTHIAKRIWGSLRYRFPEAEVSFSPEFVYWPDFIEEQRASAREGMYGKFKDMTRWPLLVLDDIGSERDPSGFAADRLNSLLAQRVRKWTVITSNLLLDQISSIDDRIASRMVREPGNVVVNMSTKDFGERSIGMS